MDKSFFEILTYFIIYSFLGWILESVYRSICEKKLINTGFLHGPFCPIYGVGAIIMLLGLNNFKGSNILIFIIAFIILTIWEYIVGYFLEKTFKTKYWDYSNHKFNIKGRVCLMNSFFWGILGVLFINFIHPFVEKGITNVNAVAIKYIIYILVGGMIIDSVISIFKINNIKTALEKVEQINEEIKEKLKEIKEIEIGPDKEKIIENIQLVIEQLKEKRNTSIKRLYKHVYRLKNAFPAINTKEITQILNHKIELKKYNIKKRKKY